MLEKISYSLASHRQCWNYVGCHRGHDSFAYCGLQNEVLLANKRLVILVLTYAFVPILLYLLNSCPETVQFTSGLYQFSHYHVEFWSHR